MTSHFPSDVNQRRFFPIKHEKGNSRGCAIINNQILFTDYCNRRLLVYNKDGCFNRYIKLSGKSGSISVINDNEIAASFSQNYIEVISMKTGKSKIKIETSGATSGISFQNGLLYVIIDTERIDVFNLTGELIRSFPCPSTRVHNISTDTRRLFLSDNSKNTLYCCDLFGSMKWEFNDDTIIDPWGISVDRNGYVYLSCRISNNLKVVSADGKYHKDILSEKDGVEFPTGIYIDKNSSCLLLCNNKSTSACLYDVFHQHFVAFT